MCVLDKTVRNHVDEGISGAISKPWQGARNKGVLGFVKVKYCLVCMPMLLNVQFREKCRVSNKEVYLFCRLEGIHGLSVMFFRYLRLSKWTQEHYRTSMLTILRFESVWCVSVCLVPYILFLRHPFLKPAKHIIKKLKAQSIMPSTVQVTYILSYRVQQERCWSRGFKHQDSYFSTRSQKTLFGFGL